MAKFRVSAEVTISVLTDVEAQSMDQAKRIARNRELPTLCYQCGGGDPEEQWCMSGELDGEPQELTVEESE